MKHLITVSATALLLAACSDNPVAPDGSPLAPASKPSLSTASVGIRIDYTDQANDLITRVLPSFDDPQAAETVRSSLLALTAHANAGELSDAHAAAQAARAALGANAASPLVLGAVSATLDVIDRDLTEAGAVASSTTLAD
jgi:hypothetical protein